MWLSFLLLIKLNSNISTRAPAESLPETTNRSIRLLATKNIISQFFIFINTKIKPLDNFREAFRMIIYGGWASYQAAANPVIKQI